MPEEPQDDIPEAKSSEEVLAQINNEVIQLVAWVLTCTSISFYEFKQNLVPKVYVLGRLFILLFLTMREENYLKTHPDGEVGYKDQGPKSRIFGCLFGKVKYWRTYLFNLNSSGGYYPLDSELGLTQDGFSMMVQSYAVRLATKMSYAQTVLLMTMFLNWSPSQRTIEETVLGFGRHTGDWFESQPAPENDGEVLIIQIDSKATPTATDDELEKRRGKRRPNPHPGSKRHRNRIRRRCRDKKPRRKKGDKSKNGKTATIIVIYSLKRSDDGTLKGPINKRVYASYAPKRHAVEIARREADKRGFSEEAGKLVQIVTDGDDDLARYCGELFPSAIHTIDIFHVMEYLWDAGRCFFDEGSEELADWVEAQKEALYDGRADDVIAEIDKRLMLLPKTGPGVKSRRERLETTRNYLAKRIKNINYNSLLEQDLEISSGMIEGAVKYVIAKRFDEGGMRWIRERAEALLQLRCIEINGDWDSFISFVHEKTRRKSQEMRCNPLLRTREHAPLPLCKAA
jgi:hypothetical protein